MSAIAHGPQGATSAASAAAATGLWGHSGPLTQPRALAPVLLRALRAADPFFIKQSNVRENGTSLGGCLRLIMVPLFIA
jgi:hypothetical protein